MEILNRNTENEMMEDGPLFKAFQTAKPMFSSDQDARAYYLKKLEQLAGAQKLTIEQLLNRIESSSKWTAEDRKAHRVSQLLSALSSE